ncbi:MAG: DJ-1/PfpI family protein [Clostridia bacterium]|nr:DJ-1/PfpI family protein [Clostridia bacterium]
MVYVFLADGFEEMEALCTIDCLRRAGIEVVSVGVTGDTVTGAHAIKVAADTTDIELSGNIEMIVLPGGMPGTTNLDKSPMVEKAIAYCSDHDIPMAAICAAPTIFGKRGLLDGKDAVCYPGCEDDMGKANMQNKAFVTDGLITTGASAGCAIRFASELVRILRGEDAASALTEALVIR